MAQPNAGPWGPIPRYTVAVELLADGSSVRARSCTSQGHHHAAAAVLMHLHERHPEAALGRVSIEAVESSYVPDPDDLIDYWDVA